MNPDDINKYYRSISYTYKGDEGWIPLTPESLAALYANKREELAMCQRYYEEAELEKAVERSDLKEANEVIKHIMSKN